MRALFASLLALGAVSAAAQTPSIDYRFDEVRRKVTLATPTQQAQTARVGQKAQSGDKVNTGWFSYALIATDAHRAKFELFGSTEVQLAGGSPGVILSLNRGRLHAMFDKITGSEPRIVQTPGALLAVRGTQYVVDVDAKGDTNIDVLEGIVEIRSPLQREPFLVHAGEAATFGRTHAPVAMPPRAGNRGPNAGKQPRGQGDQRPQGGDMHRPPGDHPEGGDSHGRPPQGGPQPRPTPGPQPPPPPKP